MIQWRFGSGAVRSWKGSRAALNGSGAGNRDPNRVAIVARETTGAGAAITAILDTYDRKAQAETRQRAALEEERAAFRHAAEQLLETVIEPTLHAIGEEVLARGHVWTVEERIDIQAQPAVAYLFRPNRPGVSGGPASELTFRCLFPDRVSTTAVIHAGKGPEEIPARSHLSSSVSPELVRGEVARFIRRALGED